MHCQGRSMAHHLHYTDLTAERVSKRERERNRERVREMGRLIENEEGREKTTGKERKG